MISRSNYILDSLPKNATVGTDSARRAAQLLHHRPDLRIFSIRGNIDTRVRKALDKEGVYDAIVLAYAGLERLNLLHVIAQVLPLDIMLPAPGQGALAVQCRNEPDMLKRLAPIQHLETASVVAAERAFLAGLGGGCSVPVAALAERGQDGGMWLRGRVSSPDGATQVDVNAAIAPMTIEAATHVGFGLAQQALENGAVAILEKSS
jgi:hydroxymethylbilane synthase